MTLKMKLEEMRVQGNGVMYCRFDALKDEKNIPVSPEIESKSGVRATIQIALVEGAADELRSCKVYDVSFTQVQ